MLRFIERMLMRRAKLLVISSPAYLTEYFEPRQKLHRNWQIPILLVENKVLELEGESALQASDPVQELPPGPPWRIGWFGMIRCQKSLDILRDLVKARTGLVEVVIRGRPSLVEFRNFEAQVNTPGILFGRTYAPGEIGGLYRSVHFNWAIDYFEAGGNSELLLPNRIYEGGRHDAVPLALANTETGRWLKCHGLGLVVKSPANELAALFENLSAACYAELKQASLSAPRGAFVADGSDCQRLLEALAKTAARDAKKAAKNRTPSEPTFRLKAH